jgi:phosphoribosylanthranilate isomerase
MSAQAPPLWIKICGLREVGAIEAAAMAGVQAVGFVFHDASPRNISIADAARLQAAVPAGIARVAVFLHPARGLVDAVLEAVQPDCLQMDVADLQALHLSTSATLLPVLRSGAAFVPPPLGSARRVLFESGRSGTGEQADWTEAAQLARQAAIVLAGGLNPANVASAIERVRPYGVDVSSGVESRRGQKSPALIREFVEAARAAHARLIHQSATAAAGEIDQCAPKP